MKFRYRHHILHVIDSLALGGAERVLVEIANATDPDSYKVSVCFTRSDRTLATELNSRITKFSLNRKHRFEIDKFRQLDTFCQQEHVELLHVHMRSSFLFISTMKALGFLQDIPVIFMDHDGDVEINNRVPLMVQIAIRVFKPYFVGVHPDLTISAMQAGVVAERAFTIPNAISFAPYRNFDENTLEQIIGYSVPRPIGIMVANIRPTKNHLFLFDALAEIRAEPWTLLLAGGATDPLYLKSCRDRIVDLGLDEKVIFLGSCTSIHRLLRLVDFGVLTSISESGPLALLEYIASGLPFVSTRVGLIGNMLHEMGVPALVEPGDLAGFVENIRELIFLKPDERKMRINHAMELAESRFDIDSVITEWHGLYRKILGIPV